jgi:hypothetical protein
MNLDTPFQHLARDLRAELEAVGLQIETTKQIRA